MEPLHTPPEASSFVLLADHQSRTPASFHSGPPVLHYHSKQCKLVIFEHDLVSVPALNAIRGDAAAAAAATNGSSGDNENGEGKEIVIDGLDVWVTSDKFLLYAPTTSTGLSITYPSISLHAIQRLRLPSPTPSEEVQGLYMQIANPAPAGSASNDDEEEESITMTIVPPTTPIEGAAQDQAQTQTETQTDGETEAAEPESATQKLYAAVSACSNLHPDPVLPGDEEYGDYDDDEEGGEGEGQEPVLQLQPGMPPPMPGSSGWITAENMHEFFDEEGNWIAGGEEPTLPLGPGAGTVRQREGEDGQDGQGEGEAANEGQDDETKWQRTS